MLKLYLLKAGRYHIRGINFNSHISNRGCITFAQTKEVPACYMPGGRWLKVEFGEKLEWLRLEKSQHQPTEARCKCTRYVFEHRKTKLCKQDENKEGETLPC